MIFKYLWSVAIGQLPNMDVSIIVSSFFAKIDVHTFSKAPNNSDQVRFVDISCDLLDYSQAEPHNTLLADDYL